MTSHRLLAPSHLGALAIIIGACTPLPNADTGGPLPGSGGASATGGASVTSGGATGSGTGGVTGTGGGVTATGGDVGTGGQTGSGGRVGGSNTGGGSMDAGVKPDSMGTGGPGGAISGGGGASGSGCAAGLGLCDDFESYGEGKVPDGRWMTVKPPTSGASLTVDGSKPYSGSKSLHIKVTTGGSANITTKPGDTAFTGITNAGYLRFMMFQTAITQPTDTHARLRARGQRQGFRGVGWDGVCV